MSLVEGGPIEETRFRFGENWSRFLATVGEERIASAERSMGRMLPGIAWPGLRFLDIGSGSGLFSLAARRLGASVVSFDFDPQSVACTEELKRRYFPDDARWTVLRGSVLDTDFLRSLGRFDLVYAWGSLHHTGEMWRAMENVAPLVADGGRLFISIYNDQGRRSRWWRRVKRAYNRLPSGLRFLVVLPSMVPTWGLSFLVDLLRLQPFRSWRTYAVDRGMSPWRDVIDWVGGYPFEVARPEQVFDFYRDRGFTLTSLKTVGGGIGCNQFVLVKEATGAV
jgi:SAM-dependent methyltransferase